MTSPLDTGNRWLVLGAAIGLSAIGGVIADRSPAFALVNESSSVPRGLYLRQPRTTPERGSMVAVTQPQVARTYLGPLGMPAEVLLIKRVTAMPGDEVCRRGTQVQTPDRRVTALERDRRGSLLPTWSGCRRLGPGELFLLGDSAASFDSRYFGPVRTTAVEGVFREAFTW